MSFPDAEPNGQVAPPLQGSVYGGHAPLVGAHVYVLTPSTIGYGGAGIAASDTPSTGTPTGGNRSTSLMCGDAPAGGSCAGSGSTISKNGQFGYHYVTTDSTGAFNLAGDYSCSPNQAVYLIATGGMPSYPGNTNAYPTSTASFVNEGNSTANYTYTTTTQENFYIGETVKITGYTSTAPVYNRTGTVLAANLTTNTFTINAAYNGSANSGSVTNESGVVTATPVANPGIINMAAVGICPSSGSFAGTVSYIYMNEVSTAALAYGLAGFGTDPFHIGVATGSGSDAATNYYQSTAYALNAMKQGMTNAGLLYDIQGGNTSTTYAGEGHIARATTPVDPATGISNGTVPQATLDTLGNILAACVDSGNTASSTSVQCTKLFNNATSDGTTTGGTIPTETGTAAFNIAHFPAGTNNPNFVANLMSIPTGNIPFSPNLSSTPNDFTVALTYTVPTSGTNTTNLLNGPDSISIDGEGNSGVWITNFYGQPVKIFATTGIPDYTTNGYLAAYPATRSVAIDLLGLAWLSVGQQSTGAYANKLVAIVNSPTSAANAVSPVAFNNLTWSTIDQTGQYLFTSSAGTINKIDMYGADGTLQSNVSPTNQATNQAWSTFDTNGAFTQCVQYGFGSVYTSTVDFQGTVYTVNNDYNSVCTANTAGNEVNTYSGFNGSGMAGSVDYNAGAPRFWGVNGTTSSGGTQLQSFKASAFIMHSYANGTGSGNNGGLNGAYATAVDGSGNIWVGNQGGGVAAFNPTSGNFLSPANGFNPGLPGVSANGAFPAIDRAGDVWLAYAGSSSGATTNIYEIIGAATPTIGPVSVGLYNAAQHGTGTGNKP